MTQFLEILEKMQFQNLSIEINYTTGSDNYFQKTELETRNVSKKKKYMPHDLRTNLNFSGGAP